MVRQARQARPGVVRRCKAGPDMDWHGQARQAWCGEDWPGAAWQGVQARIGLAWQAWPSGARSGVARSGGAWSGAARHGEVRQARSGVARKGLVRSGMARQVWRGWAGAA
jgi:hypothetical protein